MMTSTWRFRCWIGVTAGDQPAQSTCPLKWARGLFMVAGVSTWVETLKELEGLVPAYSEWQRRVGRCIKYAL